MKEKLHIAHFTNTYYPFVSGVVRSISTFREALIEMGHNIFIFCQEASQYEDDESFIFRYPSISLPIITKDFALTIPVSHFIDKALPILKLDVIHSNHPFLVGMAAAEKAKKLEIPLVFTFHTRYRDYSHYLPIDQKLVKEAIDHWLGDYMTRCQHIITPSNSIKQMLEDRFGISDRVTTIPTGLNLELFRQRDREKIRQEKGWGNETILISVGRLAKEKNWPTLIKAIAQVMANHDNLRWILIGEGKRKKALQAQTEELGIADRTEFVGLIPFEEVPNYLKAADIFCFASITETQGLVTMEAMAADLPVVAVDASGTRDVLEDGKEGLLTDNDSDALAQALEKLISDEVLVKQMREAAQEKAQSFDRMIQAEKAISVYEQAIEDRKANRYVEVDKQKPIFKLITNEKWWTSLSKIQKKIKS